MRMKGEGTGVEGRHNITVPVTPAQEWVDDQIAEDKKYTLITERKGEMATDHTCAECNTPYTIPDGVSRIDTWRSADPSPVAVLNIWGHKEDGILSERMMIHTCKRGTPEALELIDSSPPSDVPPPKKGFLHSLAERS